MIHILKDEYSWLSNFAAVEIEIRGLKFASVEHAYMSEKNKSKEWKNLCSKTCCMQADLSKKLSKHIILRDDWDGVFHENCVLEALRDFNAKTPEELLDILKNNQLRAV